MAYWVAGAVAGSAILGAVSSSDASRKASNSAKDAANLNQDQYAQTRSDLQPYVQGGYGAQSRLNDLLGLSGNSGAQGYGSLSSQFTPQDYLNNQDPGYQFQLQQGNKALQNSQAAGDGVLGGAALKGLIDYNQGMASTGYQNAWNRWNTQNQNTYNRLSGLLQTGEAAAAQTGITGASLAGNSSNALIASGNAAAAGSIGVGNSITGAINGGLGYYQYQQSLPQTYPGFNGNQWTGYINQNPASVGPTPG